MDTLKSPLSSKASTQVMEKMNIRSRTGIRVLVVVVVVVMMMMMMMVVVNSSSVLHAARNPPQGWPRLL